MTKRLLFERPEEILDADKVANPQRYEQPKGRFLVFQKPRSVWYYRQVIEQDGYTLSHNNKHWAFHQVLYFD